MISGFLFNWMAWSSGNSNCSTPLHEKPFGYWWQMTIFLVGSIANLGYMYCLGKVWYQLCGYIHVEIMRDVITNNIHHKQAVLMYGMFSNFRGTKGRE